MVKVMEAILFVQCSKSDRVPQEIRPADESRIDSMCIWYLLFEDLESYVDNG